MLLTSLALGALAVALAWPVPIALAAANWPSRSPAVALVLWQAVALAGGLSMIGALLTFGLAPFGDTLVQGLAALSGHLAAGTLPPGTAFSHAFALSGAILLGVHLVLNLGLAVVRDERSRRRHRQLVELLSSPLPERPNTRLLDHQAPVAYCLPGAIRSITVLSAGLLSILDYEELRAVIAHERAHATQRHHLVLLAFRAWRRSLPWFPIATRAEDAVAALVEMLADDRARRVVPDATLARAIATVAVGIDGTGAGAPGGAAAALETDTLAASSPSAVTRIDRLASPGRTLPAAAKVLIMASAAALLAVPTVLLIAPTLLGQRG